MTGAGKADHGDINAAVARLEQKLPGWWWSIGWCHVSSDCSIAVDGKGPDVHLIYTDDERFDSGFHNDISGNDVAAALHGAIDEALAAKGALPAEAIDRAKRRYAEVPKIPFMRGHAHEVR